MSSFNQRRLTYGLDIANQKGLEIGPLVNPMVPRSSGEIKYVDRASTEELREWYSRDPDINVDEIMEIDYVWGDQSLAEATGGDQFDYCIASHVIEHIPDLITWLQEISSILKIGGVACFAVPDKRYTFDYLRKETTTSELVENYVQRLRKPTTRQIFDHFANFVELQAHEAWSAQFDPSQLKPINTKERILNVCKDAAETGKYVDSHCSVFTEQSFFTLMRDIAEMGLLPFKVKEVFPTCPGTFEFFVQLEKIDPDFSREQIQAAFDASFDAKVNRRIEMDFQSDSACVPKIYYDTGEGYSEVETVIERYRAPGISQTLSFDLPSAPLASIRFDPADVSVSIKIEALRHGSGKQLQELPLRNLKPVRQIEEVKIDATGLTAKTIAEASDPVFSLEL